jgi:biopolymer transport protein ExbD
MARSARKLNISDGAMDMTSMIDCVFLLIIFFMVSVDLKQKDNVRLTLPDAESALSEEDAKVIIHIERSGDVSAGGRKRSEEELKSFLLHTYAQLNPNKELEPKGKDGKRWAAVLVKIRADGLTEFRDVQKVLTVCADTLFYKTAFGALGPKDKSN